MWNKYSKIGVVIVVVVVLGILIQQQTKGPQGLVTSKGGLPVQSWTTDNGAKVMYVHVPELPMVDVRLVFDAGSARDGAQPGLARMTSGMLKLGAGKWNTDEIAERFAEVGARFGTSAQRDMAVVRLRSLTDKAILETALSTVISVLQQPHFDKDELERVRKRTLLAIKSGEQSAQTIGSKLFYKALYGVHPYASPTLGTAESIKGIDREALVAFHKQYYVATNAVLAIVGAVDRKAAVELAEQLTGGLPSGIHAPALPEVPALNEPKLINKQHPATQTHILMGQPGMQRGDADYFSLYVGNHILGGSGFGSRITEEIREKRGLAYSSYSYFSPMRGKGPFILGLQTRNEQSQEALALLRKILSEFIEQGPTKEELAHSIKNITGGFPLRVDSNKDIIQYIAMIGFYGLPLDYLNTFNASVEAVTLEKIKDAFKRRVHPDTLVTVTVGGSAAQEKASTPPG